MRTHHPLFLLCLLAPLSPAQDSVSKLSALPGDAVDAYAPAEQINDYVVDMVALQSSWGKTFAIAPMAKTSQQRSVAPTFFNTLNSAYCISRTLVNGAPFLRSQYSYWNAPGFGVNDDLARNDPGVPIATGLLVGHRFAFASSEFGMGNPSTTNFEHIIGGIVNFTAARPSRLYVSRIMGAADGLTEGCSTGALALGAVDDDGDVVLRADSFQGSGGMIGACGGLVVIGNGALNDENYFRVELQNRTAVVNALSDTSTLALGAEAASTFHLLVNAGGMTGSNTHSTPNLIPRSLGVRPVLFAVNFNKEYVFESVANVATPTAALAHFAPGLSDQRGSTAHTVHNFTTLFPTSVGGTGAHLARVAPDPGQTTAVNVFGLDANGNYLSPLQRALPAPAAGLDPDQPLWAPVAPQEFDHYHSQVATSGGNSQISLGRDQAGNLLLAGTVYYGTAVAPATATTRPANYIAVAKIDPLGGGTVWTAAAWTTDNAADSGKIVYQNNTTPIGKLRAFMAPPMTGPAMSAPMIDSVGNVWFTGAYELTASPGTTRTGLFRSVLQTASFSYRLELVLESGDVFAGANSGKNYEISFITLNDNNSIASGAAWSGNISGASDRNVSTVGMATDDPRTLGGLALAATITYDMNNDGMYVSATDMPPGPDEEYVVLLYVGATKDCNANGIPDDRDIAEMLVPDGNGNGIPDSCEGLTGTPYCFGDGSGTPCPCSPVPLVGDADKGCPNSFNAGGGKLAASGNPSISADTLVMKCTLLNNGGAVVFQGTNDNGGGAGVAFGDGLRCAAGTVRRMKSHTVTVHDYQYPDPAFGDNAISIRGAVLAPGDRWYQGWYRSGLAHCNPTQNYNLTNGVKITWGM